jgi:DNA polymerase phi
MASSAKGKGSGPNLFDLFYDLAAEAESTRNAAASSLLKLVLASQESFLDAARVAQGGDGPANVSSDVQYTVTRLVKGLGSGRAAARPGFATALVALLREVPAVTTTDVYKTISDTTRTAGSMKGHEERDAYFGRIFGFLCLHRAGRLSVTNVS